MCSDLALEVEELGKLYPIFENPRDRLLQAIWGKRKRLYQPFWALEDVSFQLKRGQTLGVVGRNGSGKSTLLQLICGTLTPTTGRVWVEGRIGALLELGSGFNPEFTGLENIYLNATLLGLTQSEINSRLDKILEFAEIGDFVNQPVKTYSSGMAVRLAFSVQAHTQPDLLVVDEALAVGDEMFQKKCYSHLKRLKKQGTAILLVTHSCPQILEHCDQALLLNNGQLKLQGSPKLITTTYERLSNSPVDEWNSYLNQSNGSSKDLKKTTCEPDESESCTPQHDPHLVPSSSVSYEAHGLQIQCVEVLSQDGAPANLFRTDQPFSVCFHYRASRPFKDLQMACNIANQTGVRVTGQRHHGPICSGEERFSITFHFKDGLLPGLYFIGGGVWQNERPNHFIHRVVDICAFRITADQPVMSFGLCDLKAGEPTVQGITM
ncbi:ABC transporter ATP-binding protein [Synechococcus sp. UW179A]|uniref:ABC transporter ATP-binding protein n=1 Tax=Synechococcus sp. UW179A TaxID=2575510 RepID=UPI0010BE6438|nr:ABC transporter ATP-binding protein [Synechococcus sp. UW179A]